MKKILNKTLKTLFPLLLGAFTLYIIYDDFNFSQIWTSLKEMDMFWFTITTIFIILSHVIRGLRWKLTQVTWNLPSSRWQMPTFRSN